MKVFELTEKFRADLFKNLGFFLVSLIGLACVRLLIFQDDLKNYFSIQGIILIACLFLGVIMLSKAFDIS